MNLEELHSLLFCLEIASGVASGVVDESVAELFRDDRQPTSVSLTQLPLFSSESLNESFRSPPSGLLQVPAALRVAAEALTHLQTSDAYNLAVSSETAELLVRRIVAASGAPVRQTRSPMHSSVPRPLLLLPQHRKILAGGGVRHGVDTRSAGPAVVAVPSKAPPRVAAPPRHAPIVRPREFAEATRVQPLPVSVSESVNERPVTTGAVRRFGVTQKSGAGGDRVQDFLSKLQTGLSKLH